MENNLEFIFIDETGFNQSLIPTYGYFKVGERCTYGTYAKGKSFSVITAITKGQILGFQIFVGGVKATTFGAFLINLIKQVPDLQFNPGNYVLFMDNASIHKAKEIMPFLAKFRVLYNAAYCPFLNPIEEFFGNVKFNFRKDHAKYGPNIIERILESIDQIDNAVLFSSYIHSLTFIRECLDRKTF